MRADKKRNLHLNLMVERSVYWAVRDLARDYDISASAMARFLIVAAHEQIAGQGWERSAEKLYQLLGSSSVAEEWRAAVDKSLEKGADGQVPWN